MIPQTPLTQENLSLGRGLLRKLQTKEITEAEFEKEIAYFALECGFDELHYIPFPEKPAVLQELEQLNPKEKGELGSTFWRQDTIQAYFKTWDEAHGWNRGVRWWLKELLKRFKSYGDFVNEKKVEERLKEWEGQYYGP